MNFNMKLRIAVAHSDPLITAGLAATLALEGDLTVSVLPSPLTSMPSADLILTDCRTGIRLAQFSGTVRHHAACGRIVIVTDDESEVSIRRAMEAGVRGYLLLGVALESVVHAVRCVARGGTALDPAVATRVADSLKGDAMTQREREVLGLLMLGLSNKLIAFHLGISVGTTKSHVKQLFVKLDATTRTEVAAIAQRRGLLTPPAPATAPQSSKNGRVAHETASHR